MFECYYIVVNPFLRNMILLSFEKQKFVSPLQKTIYRYYYVLKLYEKSKHLENVVLDETLQPRWAAYQYRKIPNSVFEQTKERYKWPSFVTDRARWITLYMNNVSSRERTSAGIIGPWQLDHRDKSHAAAAHRTYYHNNIIYYVSVRIVLHFIIIIIILRRNYTSTSTNRCLHSLSTFSRAKILPW